MWSVWPTLTAVALCAFWARRTQPRGANPTTAREWTLEVLIAAAFACLFAVLTGLQFPKYHIIGGDYSEIDVAGYCRSLGSLRDGAPADWGAKHSPFAGLLLREPTRQLGILGALTGGALLSAGALGLGIYSWARIAAGRVAGACAVLLAAANQTFVWLARSPSFYPETTALCVIGAAGVAASLRWRTVPALLVGAGGAGLILAADVRFCTVGLWCAGLVGIRAGIGPVRALPTRLLCVIGPLALSWWAAGLAHTAVMGDRPPAGVVLQALGYLKEVPGFAAPAPQWIAARDFAWGVSPLAALPGALTALATLAASVPKGAADGPTELAARAAWLTPWAIPLVFAFGAALPMIRRRPSAWFAAFAPAFPLLLNLYVVFHTFAQPTYFTLGMSALPVLLGVGIAAAGGPRWTIKPSIALIGLLTLAVLGVIPGFLSPVAPWRVPYVDRNRVYDAYARATGGTPVPALDREWPNGEDVVQCVQALEADALQQHLWMPWSDAPRATRGRAN
jgi:hypothetical protein